MPAFHFLQNQARSEMKARIKAGVPEKELHQITFASEEDILWVRDGKEFKLKGRLYDVVRREGNTFFCVDDEQETQLFAHLDELCREQQDQDGNPVQDFIKLMSQGEHSNSDLSLNKYEVRGTRYGVLSQNELQAITSEPYSPPEMI